MDIELLLETLTLTELLLGTITLLICIGIILYIGYMIEYND